MRGAANGHHRWASSSTSPFDSSNTSTTWALVIARSTSADSRFRSAPSTSSTSAFRTTISTAFAFLNFFRFRRRARRLGHRSSLCPVSSHVSPSSLFHLGCPRHRACRSRRHELHGFSDRYFTSWDDHRSSDELRNTFQRLRLLGDPSSNHAWRHESHGLVVA